MWCGCDKVSTLHSSRNFEKGINWIFSRALHVELKTSAFDGADEGPATWKTALWKWSGSPGGHLIEPASKTCSCGKEQQQPPGKVLPAVEGGFHFPVLSTDETVLDWWVQSQPPQGKRHKAILEWTQRSAIKVPLSWWLKGWRHPIMKEDWDSWNCSALRRLRGNTWWRGIKKMEPESSQLYSVTGREEADKIEIQQIPFQHKKTPFLPWRQLNTRMCFPEKSRSPHPGICSNPAWIQS